MAEASPIPSDNLSGARDFSWRNFAGLALLTVAALLVMGYHPGLEDDAFYLAAIKRNLNPALFPHDADFFRLQFQATIFDQMIALSARLTHLPVLTGLAPLAAGSHFFRPARLLANQPAAAFHSLSAWAAVTLVAVLLTLPVSGIAINLADQYLHPRTLATAAILAAIVAVLDRRLWFAGVLLAIAFAIHAIMASFGISFLCFLVVESASFQSAGAVGIATALALLIPLGWIFEPASDAWRQAAATRGFYFLGRWEWYEWLGVFAPLILLFVFRRFAARAAKTHRQLRIAAAGFESALLRRLSNRGRPRDHASPQSSSACGRLSPCATCTCSIFSSS